MTWTRICTALIALHIAAPVAAGSVPATCDTINAVLADAKGGETISLKSRGEAGDFAWGYDPGDYRRWHGFDTLPDMWTNA